MFLKVCYFHCVVLVSGDAQRLQDPGRDFDESNKQSKDDHIAHHGLIGLLRLLIWVHLVGQDTKKSRLSISTCKMSQLDVWDITSLQKIQGGLFNWPPLKITSSKKK